MPELEVGTQRIRFEDHGGEGPALVFCHAFAMDHSMFMPQIRQFSGTHRCVAWDQRGHGGSPTGRPFTLWDSARDAMALLDHLGIDRATFIGTSQGGFVSMRAALLAPRRVAGLVVLGSSASAERRWQRMSYQMLSLALRGTRALGLPQLPLNVLRDICFGARFDGSGWMDRWRQWPSAQFTRALDALVARDDISPRLNEIKAPALVLHGSADQAYSLDVARIIADGLADCRDFVAVEGGAHFLSLTDPAPVNAALRSFLEDVG